MPKWSNLKRFCERDGWELYKKTDHFYYRKLMPDGTLKLTKVSNSTGDIPKPLWKLIRSKQLQVTQEYFNKVK
jgi:hypothetical protein